MTDPNFLGYSTHVWSAAFLTSLGFIFGGIAGAWIALVLMMVFAFVKEFWYDAKHEPNQTLWNNIWDTVFYFGGCVLAMVIVYLHVLL
jgi:hypothetical protein